MSDFDRIADEVWPKAIALLPGMDSLAAKAEVLAIGLQESRFTARRQDGGPAHGYFQFEKFGGVIGVLTHPVTRGFAVKICDHQKVETTAEACYQAIINDDILACCFARLLLYTLPDKLPAQNERERGWQQYTAAWRPGMPHRATWNAFFDRAWLKVLPTIN